MRIIKKVALTFVILLLALPAFAGKVTRPRAAEVAAEFFQLPVTKGVASLSTAEEAPNAWVAFNRNGGGFVVISLNDAVLPVLAYSPNGKFPSKDEMPETMAWWFTQLEMQIASISDDVPATKSVDARWENPARARGTSLLYETASWNQHEPFNNNCPLLDGQRCITGCVAIAGSILARYFRWPDAGVGTVPASSQGGPYYSAHTLGYTYDWDNMPLDYFDNYTDIQTDAVATLVYDMATVSRVRFGVDGSAASNEDLLDGLKRYMKYDKGAYLASRRGYSETGWTELLKNILDNYGPSVYTGDDTGGRGGHTFIIDGYDAEGRFHFNWGWGFGNCYCELSSLNASSYNFALNQQVMVGLVPDYDGSSSLQDNLSFLSGNGYSGIELSTASVKENVRFNCKVGNIVSNSFDFQGKLFISLYDKNGNFKQDIDIYGGIDIQIPSNSLIYFSKLTCCITTTIAPGDRIKVRYVGQYSEGIIDSGENCVTEIIVMPEGGGDNPDPTAGYTAAQTAASTSLHYDRTVKVLTLTFAHPANWSVKNSGGTAVAEGVASAGGNVAIDFSGYASGTYTISVGSAEDPFVFTITK